MSEPKAEAAKPVTIKKYANRRLYNTATSSYVTLDHLCQMVKDGVEFQVFDAKTGEDITRSVLTQIIVEEEGKGGQNLLPISFLRQLIGFYGDNLQHLVPRYLEVSMQSFARNQEQFRNMMTNAWGGLFPFGRLDDAGKQNMAFFENAMKMWAPFLAKNAGAIEGMMMPADPAAPAASDSNGAQALTELQSKIDGLQRQIDDFMAQARDSARK
ncbi:MAG: polyhydroxyalkanoate synthesis repressor PhaR [Rhodospirillales bacterium]|nr:MAG: polyhydroxyalkanoate synthesis repressor PhaR [Rhodospirillales bacterium]